MSCVRRAFFPVLFVALTASSGYAQTASPRHCYATTPIKDANDLRVIASCTEKNEHFTTTNTNNTGRIHVIVMGLAEYREQYDQKAPDKKDPQLDPSRMILYVDGRPLPRFFGQLPDRQHSHLTFDLGELGRKTSDSPDSLAAWKQLLSSGIRDRQMSLSVGFQSRAPLLTEVDDFTIRAIEVFWLIVWVVLALALLLILVIAARKSDMLRVPGAPPDPDPNHPDMVPRKAHSLARWQMASWFFAILVAYTFIYLVTGALDALSPTVLGLMGISAAAGFAATVVDTTGSKPGDKAPRTEGLREDLMSEGSGVSLPRLQMAVWTFVLILIFARAVYDTLSMPDFNPTLLGLMGISAGTYVGFKNPDKKSAAAESQADKDKDKKAAELKSVTTEGETAKKKD
jgi:uncharacterized RDD family membrane protein YckC